MSGDGILARLRLLPVARGDRPWFATLLGAVRIVTAALVVANGIAGVLAGVAVLGTGPLGWAGIGTAVAATAAMVVVLVRGDERFPVHLAAVGGLLSGLTLGITSAGQAGLETPLWWPLRFVLGAMMFAVIAGRTWHRAILVALVIGFHAAARLAERSAEGASWDLDLARPLAVELGFALFNALLMLTVMEMLLRAGELADRSHAVAVREAERAAVAMARERSAREVERFIHDEVLHTLRTVAMDRRDVPSSAARAAAARLDRLLSETPLRPARRGDLAEAIDVAAAQLPLTVVVESERPVVVPEDVETAMVQATMEALRNVHRHAGTGHALVRISRDGLRTAVTVTDEGVGFELADVDPRWGLVSSVHQRMWDVGGDVDLRTRPGEGTTLTLTWSASAPDHGPRFHHSAGYGALSQLYVLASWVLLPYIAFALWNATWLAPLLAVPWAGWCATLVLIVTAAAVVLVSLHSRPHHWSAGLLILVALATTALHGWALPAGLTVPYLFWAGPSSLVVLVPLTLFHWPPLILATGAGVTVTMLAFSLEAAGPGATFTTFLPTIAVPLVGALGYWVVRLVLDALAWETYRTGQETARSRSAALARSEFVATLTERMEKRRESIGSFVRDVAEGLLDTEDPEVRAQADALERGARDRMLPDIDLDLGPVAALLRSLGHATTLRMAEDVPLEVRQRGARSLGMVIAAGSRHEPLDVTLTIMRAGAHWRTGLRVVGADRRTRERLVEYVGPGWAASSDTESVHLSTTDPVGAHNG